MNVANVTARKFFGLLKLDADGTVLYSRAEGDDEGNRPPDDIVGCDFYSGVACFKNVEDFREHLDRFVKSHDRAGGFSFVCEYEDGDVPVRVLLAQVRERMDDSRTKAVLVHIRQVS